MVLILGIVKGLSKYWYWVLLRPFMNIGIGIGYCKGFFKKLVLVLGIVKASLEILGIGIGVKKWYCSCLYHNLILSKKNGNQLK